jgi:hypothetical protein
MMLRLLLIGAALLAMTVPSSALSFNDMNGNDLNRLCEQPSQDPTPRKSTKVELACSNFEGNLFTKLEKQGKVCGGTRDDDLEFGDFLKTHPDLATKPAETAYAAFVMQEWRCNRP